jgi:hypothetical protein
MRRRAHCGVSSRRRNHRGHSISTARAGKTSLLSGMGYSVFPPCGWWTNAAICGSRTPVLTLSGMSLQCSPSISQNPNERARVHELLREQNRSSEPPPRFSARRRAESPQGARRPARTARRSWTNLTRYGSDCRNPNAAQPQFFQPRDFSAATACHGLNGKSPRRGEGAKQRLVRRNSLDQAQARGRKQARRGARACLADSTGRARRAFSQTFSPLAHGGPRDFCRVQSVGSDSRPSRPQKNFRQFLTV